MINIADNPSVLALVAKAAAEQREPAAAPAIENSVAEPTPAAPAYPAKSLTLVGGRYRPVDPGK